MESSLRPGDMLLLIGGAGFGQIPAGMGKQPSKSVLDSISFTRGWIVLLGF